MSIERIQPSSGGVPLHDTHTNELYAAIYYFYLTKLFEFMSESWEKFGQSVRQEGAKSREASLARQKRAARLNGERLYRRRMH